MCGFQLRAEEGGMQKRALGFSCVTCSSCTHLTGTGAFLSTPGWSAAHSLSSLWEWPGLAPATWLQHSSAKGIDGERSACGFYLQA